MTISIIVNVIIIDSITVNDIDVVVNVLLSTLILLLLLLNCY